jgi:beta-glucanase (GH16 family)
MLMKPSVATLLVSSGLAVASPPGSSVTDLFEMTFADEFAGSMLDEMVWSATDGCSGAICRFPENVSVSNGILQLWTLDADGGLPADYTTGRIDTLDTFRYGYLEMSARATAYSGVNNAMFSTGGVSFGPPQFYLPDSASFTDWSGQIAFGDFQLPTPNGSTGEQFASAFEDTFADGNDLSDGFRTYALQWTEANELIWFFEGTEIDRYQIPDSAAFANAVNWAIGSAINGTDFGLVDPNVVGTSMDVDYVRLYQKKDIVLGGDNFAGSAGSLDGRGGGEGWAGPWSVVSGSVDVEGAGNNIGLPGIDLIDPSGDRLDSTGPARADRDLGVNISLSQDREWWVAALVNKADDGNFRIAFKRSSDQLTRWAVGIDDDERLNIEMASLGQTGTGVAPVGETFLLVSQLISVPSGSDRVNLAIFEDGDVVPSNGNDIVWDLTRTTVSSLTHDIMSFDVFQGSVTFDELRIGGTFADVIDPSGSPTSYEAFDYTGTGLDGQGGGTGWGSNWSVLGGFFALSDDDTSLVNPPTPSTEDREGTGDQLVFSDGVAEREIADAFSVGEDNTYFASALINKDPGTDLLIELLDGSDNSRWRFGLPAAGAAQGGITGTNIAGDVAGSSLSYPTGVSLATSGSRIDQNGTGSAVLPLSSSVFATGGVTRYVSFIARKSVDGAFALRFRRASDGIARWSTEVNADGSVRAEVFGGVTSAAGLFPNDEEVMVIAKFLGDAANDTAEVLVLREGDSIPADESEVTWDVAQVGTTSVTMQEMFIEVLAGQVEIDEVIYGSTFASVLNSGSNRLDVDSFDYPGGSINGNGGWTGDLNIAGVADSSGEPIFMVSRFQSRSPLGAGTWLNAYREPRIPVEAHGRESPSSPGSRPCSVHARGPRDCALPQAAFLGRSTRSITG